MNDSPATPVSRSIDNPRVCVVGGGNAAQTLAALLPSRGLETFVFAPYADEAERLQRGLAEQGHIVAEFAPHNSPAGTVSGTPTRVSRHAAEVIPDTDVLILPLPSFAYRSVLETVRPYLRSGCYICATPGQGGFDWVAREVLGDRVHDMVLFATLPMPFNCRITDFGKHVEVQEFKRRYRVGVTPATKANSVIALNEKLFGATESIGPFLNATLYPINAVLHPARLYTLCKDWRPGDKLEGNPYFYEDMTEEAGALMDEVSGEVVATGEALGAAGVRGVELPHLFDFLTRYVYDDPSPDLTTFFRSNGAYKGFRCPFKADGEGWVPDFSSRYFTEDIPLGLCIYKGVADLVGAPTPSIDRIIAWAQTHMCKEYIVEGRLRGRHVSETNAPQRFGIDDVATLANWSTTLG